uniref:Uncharacterized protein n=1 Tax=Caenorhabditis japonica TaxID=281687 RepID=A0A8R1HZT6_CAEJA
MYSVSSLCDDPCVSLFDEHLIIIILFIFFSVKNIVNMTPRKITLWTRQFPCQKMPLEALWHRTSLPV